VGFELHRAYQLHVCTDDVNLLDENINIIKKSTEAVLDAGKEVGLEVNVEKNSVHVHILSPDDRTESLYKGRYIF
jgi:hypothetical protein